MYASTLFYNNLQFLNFWPQSMLHQMLLKWRVLQCLKKRGWRGTWVSIALHSRLITVLSRNSRCITYIQAKCLSKLTQGLECCEE
jgi:hypothetical protein